MKYITTTLLIITMALPGYSQIIKGVVMDKTDRSEINFASVYINGTYIGTNTDQKGYFELDISKYNSLPITISALGYYSITLNEFQVDQKMEIFLSRKMYELNSVTVTARFHPAERTENMKIFRSQFLGSSLNGNKCVILNEQDINFITSGDSLKAYASKPVLIDNFGLGYKVTYYLDRFVYDKKSGYFLFNGNAIFNEDMSISSGKKKIYEKRRRAAYTGSLAHFFSSLWSNSLDINGFSIQNFDGKTIKYEDIVILGFNMKKQISCKNDLYIYFLSRSSDTYIEFLKERVFFDKTGYFDGTGVKIIGQMALQRVGDLLPIEYRVTHTNSQKMEDK